MELNPGYKRVETGVIPETWDYRPIADYAQLESGHTPSKKVAAYWDGTVPWVSLHDTLALENTFIDDTSLKISELGLARSSARLLPAGTVVFSRTATVGKASIITKPMATSQDFANYICGPDLDNEYLVHLFRAMGSTWRSLMAGSTHNTIYMPAFKKLQIVAPPLAEQKAIAGALADVDATIGAMTKLLAKKRDLRTATMQRLLTGKVRLNNASKPWQLKHLGDVLRIRHGKSQKKVEDPAGKYPILATGGQIGTANEALFSGPSVLIGRKGTIDKPQFMPTPFWSVDTLFYSELIGENVAKFFYYLFHFIDWKRYNEASGVPSLSSRTIEKIEVRCPEPDEQKDIVAVLTDLDDEIFAHEAAIRKNHALKQAMMQALLTGRVRLPVGTVDDAGMELVDA